MWFGILLVPWRPWSSKPYLDAEPPSTRRSLGNVSVLIPARNEAALIQTTIRALVDQGRDLRIILVDDQSNDATVQRAVAIKPDLRVVRGRPLPEAWSGKLWALEQGYRVIDTPYTLLTDADIELAPGIVSSALDRMEAEKIQLLSLMARPHMSGLWEKMLMPAFVYFFKLLYPFRLSNADRSRIAAAAGGFILIETRLLHDLGGFADMKEALIDDCAFARRVKTADNKIWVGLSRSVRSLRCYTQLSDIWDMVARTAYTQLNYSLGLLLLCTTVMLIGFLAPLLGLWHPETEIRVMSAAALLVMMTSYLAVLQFYARTKLWALAMPLIGLLFLGMTWDSAIRYWKGSRATWRDRTYLR